MLVVVTVRSGPWLAMSQPFGLGYPQRTDPIVRAPSGYHGPGGCRSLRHRPERTARLVPDGRHDGAVLARSARLRARRRCRGVQAEELAAALEQLHKPLGRT